MRELQKKHEGGEFIYHRSVLILSLSLSLSIYDAANTSVWYVVFYYCDISLSSFLSFLPRCLWRGGGGKEDLMRLILV
jgi:hypothetical protein